MSAVLYICKPVFNKTTLHWRTLAPTKSKRLAAVRKAKKGEPAAEKTGTLPTQPQAEAKHQEGAQPQAKTPQEEVPRETANV